MFLALRRVLINKQAFRKYVTSSPVNVPTEKVVKVQINGRELDVPDNATVMQACTLAGHDIPRFCYHDRLGIAGNCRMCLVQVNEGAKLVASCAAPVMPNMRISTESDAVKKGREGVMEFLLANHPLDCPICDQGGECDLQDQAMAFGSDRSRLNLNVQSKRSVEDKNFGPLIKTSMNRCIHCTRCVRFANEVAGVQDLGTTGRGNDMQIGTYIGKMVDSPLSGNIIDLCPVGALTSKPYAFTARPWELRSTDSIDVMDAVGANIKVDSRGMEVMRILPRINESINEEWLADKSRFACDALRRQRLVQPMIKMEGTLVPESWEDALTNISEKINSIKAEEISCIIGRFADVESIASLKTLFPSSNLLIDGTSINPGNSPLLRELRFHTSIEGVEDADAILLVGCDPLKDAPLLAARLRKTWLRANVKIAYIGAGNPNMTVEYKKLGKDFTAMDQVLNGECEFGEQFANAKRPMIIVGQNALLDHPDAQMTLQKMVSLTKKYPAMLQDGWCGFNMLPLTASITGALQSGCLPGAIPSSSKLIYLLNADDFATSLPSDAFVVYQGHHGDFGASRADVILPSAAYTEKDSTYVNMEGRVQHTRTAVSMPGESRADWSILRALSEFCGNPLPWDDLPTLQKVIHNMDGFSHTGLPGSQRLSTLLSLKTEIHPDTKVKPTSYEAARSDYYMTDCISRNSPTMAKCSLAFTTKTPLTDCE